MAAPPSYQQAGAYPTTQQGHPTGEQAETNVALISKEGEVPVKSDGGYNYHGVPQGEGSHEGGYPPTTGYPPAAGGYPPPAGGYPPAAGGYPPAGAYPPQPPPAAPQAGMYNYPPPVEGGNPGPGFVSVTPGQPADDSNYGDETPFAGNSFSDKAIRRAFIKKVYLILTAQLSVTVGFIAFFLLYSPARMWVARNSWFYYCSYGTFLVTYIALVCCPSVRRKHPGNMICLAIFTLAFSYMTGTIASFYNTQSVLIAAGITTAVCLSITLFAIQTKIDFTMCTGLMFAACMVLFFFGWACMIVYFVSGPNYILQCVYGAVAALIFALFLTYDTQMIMGGRKVELSPEEYIYGALQLYLDVVYIFLMILSIFGSRGD